MKIILLMTILIGIGFKFSWAEDDHDHDHDHSHQEEVHEKDNHNQKKKKPQHKEHEKKHNDHQEHDDDHKHGHDDSHGEHEESKENHSHDHEESEDEHAHEHGEDSFGEGKAITEVYNEGEKFKLSESSQKLLDIKVSSLNEVEPGHHKVPKSSLVRFQARQGVFVLRDGWFQLIELDSEAKKNSGGWLVKSKKLQSLESIVISGVPLLRVAHLQASGQGGKGHAH